MRLKDLRKTKGLTQEALQEMTGVDQSTISALESGRIKAPSWEIVVRLARALEVSPEELFPVAELEAETKTA